MPSASRSRLHGPTGGIWGAFTVSTNPTSETKAEMELRWQREVIEEWLDSSQISETARGQLQQVLDDIETRLAVLQHNDSRQPGRRAS